MSGGIELVVFDMDGVLAQLDRARRLERMAEMTGRDPAFLHAALWESDFEPAAEAGAWATGDAYLAELNRRIEGSLSREQFLSARRDAMTVDARTLEIARRVGERCGIALLTNNGSLLLECLPEILPEVHRLFGDSAHASCQFGARKPDLAVFQRLLAHHRVEPGSAVFIDDEEENVRGARAAGLHAILHAGPDALRQRLVELGVAVDGR